MDSRLLWLALAAFVGSTEGGMVVGLLPSIGEDMHITVGQSGQVVLGYSLAYAIGTPVLSVLLGGMGRRRILAGAEFILAVCALLIALSPFFAWLVGARTLLAVGAGLFTATALATAALIAAPGQRGRALQVVTMGQSLAVLIGVPLGAWVGTHFSWRFDYVAIAAMATAAAVALYVKLPRGMHGDGNQQSIGDRIKVLGNPGVGPALLVTLLFMVATYPPIIFVGAVMTQAGISHDLLPLPLLGNGIGALAASFTAGRIADRLGNKLTITVATLVLILALGIVVLLPSLPADSRTAALLGAFMLFGYVGWGFWIAHCSEMAHLAPSSVPVAISLDLTALNIGVAIAAGFGGMVIDRWGVNVLCLAAIPMAVIGLVVWAMLPVRPEA